MKRFIESHKEEQFDIVIIGGGISGAAVAYDAASRGLKVALLEMHDFGWATSAATSKLIHGGLRYLYNMEFGLVRESLRERRILENIAPNFVYPIPFMVPNYGRFKDNKYVILAGLTMYDIFAFDKKWTWDKSKRIPNHTTFSRKKTMEREPKLRRKGLTGSSYYYDCQSIFPERLTLAFVKSAVKYGAKVANYAKVENFIYEDGKRIAGVKVRDLLSNKLIDVRGSLTINCGGPWVDIISGIAEQGNNSHQIKRSEGIHIIVRKILKSGAVTLMTPKGRHFFLIPWRGHSLIGTTDKEFEGTPESYQVTRKNIEELIAEVNDSFGDGDLSYKDVIHAFGGLRPLVDDQTEGTYASSRKYEIHNNALDGYEGLITVEGGKYTTSRNLAVNVMRMAQRKLKVRLPKSQTDKEYLVGCEIEDMNTFLASIKSENVDFNERTMEYLGRNYGTEYAEVLDIARRRTELKERIDDDGEILAQAAYAVRQEMARTLSDILLRRSGIGTLGYPGDAVVKKVARVAAKELKWTEARTRKEIADIKKALLLPR